MNILIFANFANIRKQTQQKTVKGELVIKFRFENPPATSNQRESDLELSHAK